MPRPPSSFRRAVAVCLGAWASALTACAGVPVAAANAVWVDPGWTGPEVGTPAQPVRSLAAAIGRLGEGCGEIRLRAGRHPAGITLPPACRIIGEDGAVVTGGDGAAVLVAPSGASLAHLTVEGGERGLEAGGSSELRDVSWRGQRVEAIAAHGRLVAHGGVFSTTGAPRGVSLAEGAEVSLSDVRFEGPFHRAVASREARLTLTRVRFEGAATAVHAIGGRVELDDLWVGGGADPAFVLAGVGGWGRVLRVFGHEYALLVRNAKNLELDEVSSYRALRAAVGLITSEVKVRSLVVVAPGSFGGVQVVGGKVELDRFWIHRARAQAFTSRGAELVLRDGWVTGVDGGDGSEGDAVQVRAGTARIDRLTVLAAAGACLVAGEAVAVSASRLRLLGCAHGVVLEGEARVDASDTVVARAQAALHVEAGSRLTVDGLRSFANREGMFQLDCEHGARATLTVVRAFDPVLPFAACVELP